MHGMDKELTELHGMLKTTEADIKRGANQVLMVHPASKIKKGSWSKRKNSKGGMSEGVPSTASVTKSAKPPGTVCYYCKEDGHWKRNCTKYLADKAKGGSTTSDSGTIVVNVIYIYLSGSTSSTWVYDTRSIVHICNSMQGLANSRSMGKDEVDIRVGNRARVAALRVGVMELRLPSGFMMELNNCYYVPVLSRNIISASCLMSQGYESNLYLL